MPGRPNLERKPTRDAKQARDGVATDRIAMDAASDNSVQLDQPLASQPRLQDASDMARSKAASPASEPAPACACPSGARK
ncbi:hypothetical protein BTI_5745 [Burkholderia thailandensis MSMB121]|nr:hypothetical protein BTI_5745 [Burkholderia thailandensis MSMB121]ATF32866.1 hypothetical protein CO709_05420 [Burkholderia thailandensis]KST70962.1 hypothetical protein WS76_20340 [Burkholderia humptydooensis]